jgi:polysaccharide export outer membrane protein
LISITRTRNGHAVVLDANETTSVEPGDVIDVKNEMPRVLPHDEAAARPLTSRSNKTEETQAGETISAISR